MTIPDNVAEALFVHEYYCQNCSKFGSLMETAGFITEYSASCFDCGKPLVFIDKLIVVEGDFG